MKLKTPFKNYPEYDDRPKPAKSSINKENDKAYYRSREISMFNHEHGSNGDKRQRQGQNKLQKRDSFRQESKLQFHNAQKLKHFQQIKANNIDDLNHKIQKMISKLSEEVSPYNSFVVPNYDSKMRFKTDYTDMPSTVSSQNNEQVVTLENYNKKKMAQSFIVSNQLLQERRINQSKNSNLDQIRRKYKEGSNVTKGKIIKHQKSMSTFSNNSKAEQSNFQSNANAELIRFRQKLKQNNQKDRRELCKQLKYTSSPIEVKEKPIKNMKAASKNIDQQLKRYLKRLNAYNSKKLIGLANEGQIERIPLGDKTNSNNSYLKYSPFKRTQQYSLKIKHDKPFEPLIQYFQQTQQPLTADFRQLSDKNQLKLLLKNLTNQISLDQEFRNCKKWFTKLNNPSKWSQLIGQVEQLQLNLDHASIKQIFSMRQQQQNPFYTPRHNEFDFKLMVELFAKCEQHWFQNIVKKYNRERLFQSGFRNSKIDVSNKGYLTIQDFVRFINIEIDVQIRNRDIVIIFQRLRSDDYLCFEDLMQVISC